MKLYQIYFSPTGGTKRVTEILGSAWDCEKKEIDLFSNKEDGIENSFTPEDICIVAVPSFGGRVPSAALALLKNMKGGGSRTILTAVYGNRDYDDTLLELKETLDKAGFHCVAAVAAVAEHSIIHKFGAGRPDSEDKKELEDFAGKIKIHLEGNWIGKELSVPGNHPYREYNGVPMKPAADKNCTGCGLCVQQCPVGAIPPQDPASVEKDKCISCMHCIAICPNHARRNKKLLLFIASQKMKKSCSSRKENSLFL